MVKKICMLVRNEFLPDVRVFNEGKALQSLGYDVRVLAIKSDEKLPTFEVMDGLPVHRIRLKKGPLFFDFSSPLYHLITARQMAKAAMNLDCDVYHCHDLYTLPAGMWIRLRTWKEIVYDAHEASYASLFSNIEGKTPKRVRWLVGEVSERLLSKFASAFIVPTESTSRTKGYAESVAVVPYRPYARYFNPDNVDKELERKYAKQKTVLYVGGIDKRKGFYELLGALSLLKDKISDVKLIILGKVSINEEISSALKRHRVEDCVDIFSWIPYWDVAKYINASNVGVIPIHREIRSYQMAIPVKLLDFMSCGLPIVCSALPEMQRIVEETDCGIVVDPLTPENLSKAIENVLNSDVDSYRRNALTAISQRFGFEDMVNALKDVYEALEEGGHHLPYGDERP